MALKSNIQSIDGIQIQYPIDMWYLNAISSQQVVYKSNFQSTGVI